MSLTELKERVAEANEHFKKADNLTEVINCDGLLLNYINILGGENFAKVKNKPVFTTSKGEIKAMAILKIIQGNHVLFVDYGKTHEGAFYIEGNTIKTDDEQAVDIDNFILERTLNREYFEILYLQMLLETPAKPMAINE